jgi:hypothetical protein
MLIDFPERRIVSFLDRCVLQGEGGDKPAGHGTYIPPLLRKPMSRLGG